MMHFPLWKKLTVFFVLILGTLAVVPNFLTQEQRDALPPFLPSRTITLGLDLQGGSHLVLEVDINKVVAQAYDNLADEVRMVLQKTKTEDGGRVYYRGLRANGTEGVSFSLTKPDQQALITKQLRSDIRSVVMDVTDTQVFMHFSDTRLAEMRSHAMEQTLEILRTRVDEFGVAEPVVHRQGDSRIVIELPGVGNVERAKGVIGRTAQLSFHMVDDSADASAAALRQLPPDRVVMYEETSDGRGGTARYPYVLYKRPAITGEHLADAYSGFDQYNQPAIFIRFDGVGTRRFADITTQFTGRRMAIVLDGKVYSAPRLNEPILGGSAQITGAFSVPEAEDLATVLRAGALPAPVKIVEERTVGPSLGQESVNAGAKAVVIGFVAVMVMMVMFYRGFGLTANLALLANVVLILGAMSLLQSTLTLPGIAGIVLTIGMAVDANVIIFERIRDEIRSGKKPRTALDNGFESAFTTIFDANITTLIAAIVLFIIGSGPIKGFALTLSIGIATSMFTAIMLTRFVLVVWVNKRKPKTIAV